MRSGLPIIPFRPTLPELLHRAAEQFGSDDYVVEWHRRISFREADDRSAMIARCLLDGGVGKGTRVGIALPTGVDWVLAWLACARIGAMPMLFPATYRPGELRRSLRISDAAILIAGPTLLGKDYEAFLEEAIPTLGTHNSGPLRDLDVPYLRSIWLTDSSDRSWATPIDFATPAPGATTAELLAAVETEVSPADPLLVIYTSGSAADPKAVVHTHGATIRKVRPELGMGLPASFPGRTFCAMPFFWIGGPQELLGALHSGATIVTQDRFEAGVALDLLERERCTSILGWASVLEQLIAHPSFGSRDLGSLSVTMPGGPIVSSRGDPLNLGMTETFGPHGNPEWFDYKVVHATTGAPVGAGGEGEFCVRGFGLMAALYKKEREETFDEDGYYHTGDRGYLEDGRIWFKGRYSEMIKSGGANVSPLEVEQVLTSFPDVRMAFVLGIDDEQSGEAVAAVVVPGPGVELDPHDLRARLRTELSAYKVPTQWVTLDEDQIPWLASGKPDKRTLREHF